MNGQNPYISATRGFLEGYIQSQQIRQENKDRAVMNQYRQSLMDLHKVQAERAMLPPKERQYQVNWYEEATGRKQSRLIPESQYGNFMSALESQGHTLDEPESLEDQLNFWMNAEKKATGAEPSDIFAKLMAKQMGTESKDYSNVDVANYAKQRQAEILGKLQGKPPFKEWYAGHASRLGLNPDPDDPRHHYDYRAAYKAGVEPKLSKKDNKYHWDSRFKDDDLEGGVHPNLFVDEINTKTGEPAKSIFTPGLMGMADQWLTPERTTPTEVQSPFRKDYTQEPLVEPDYSPLDKRLFDTTPEIADPQDLVSRSQKIIKEGRLHPGLITINSFEQDFALDESTGEPEIAMENGKEIGLKMENGHIIKIGDPVRFKGKDYVYQGNGQWWSD